MFLVPWLETLQWVKEHTPYQLIKKRRLNFITIHYLYIISMTILGSILLYPAGGLSYIDALFFASGCATQSGLNTVDVNMLNTYQQVILYIIPMFCTPIFIHGFVVFVRLYWFERRFQNIVRESRHLRSTRSRMKTDPKDIGDPGLAEKGVLGRNIVVLHKDGLEAGANGHLEKLDETEESRTTSESSQTHKPQTEPIPFQREITFADEITRHHFDDSAPVQLPQLSQEQHIAIRENQRNPKDKSALRIPGPRDFDQGREPETLGAGDDGGEIAHQLTNKTDNLGGLESPMAKRNISIDEPDHTPRPRGDTSTIPKLAKRKSDLEDMANIPTEEIPPPSARLRARVGTFSSLKDWASREHEPPATPYLSWQPTIGRNSAFVDLTEEQREELGGIEYRSLKTLRVVLIAYYGLFHLLGVITMLPWILRTPPWDSVVREDGVNKAWWGIFTPASMFNDVGFTLTPDSMQSFQKAVLPLLLGSYLIIIGNTGFPCMLRLVIWILSKIATRGSGVWDELMFLLDHPRRCFTLLFPSTATWWLFWILVALNGLDIILFIVLDLNDESLTSINPAGYRVLNGLFQAASTRTAGLASVNIANLHAGVQVSYLIMMYISVYPIAISMRRTNVYEEKSLGIYGSSSDEGDHEKEPSYVGAHLRKQLSFDLWYIFLGLFIIAITEGRRLENTNELAFTIFSVLFEIVSAYGTVGLSLGYPTANSSFSGQFTVLSKLVIIAMEIRGRHRGLPYALDRAILIPSDQVHNKEDVDAGRRVQRRNSNLSTVPAAAAVGSRTSTVSRTPTANLPPFRSRHSAEASAREEADRLTDSNGPVKHGNGGPVRRGVGKMMAGVADGTHL